MKSLPPETAFAAWEYLGSLDPDGFTRLQVEVRSLWPATVALRGLDFDRALLAFIAERCLTNKAA
ncbi:MAG TPA: hypothetical protein VET82_12660 [Candidatus Eisenbacteria bacterium]|jgi:hypothetical protein|nr:hypothetical protein [Candidatus Eisenbacteria bacterium]